MILIQNTQEDIFKTHEQDTKSPHRNPNSSPNRH